MSKIVVLHNEDNVAVVIADVNNGDNLETVDLSITVLTDLTFGHKIASRPITKGDHIIKYGVPIGVATADVKVGEHVHVHNMESLYMKQFTK